MRHRILALLVFAAWLAGCTSPKPAKPNVLFITVDTLRADRLGCYGYRQVETPAMDALAREGILFERAIAQVPLTWPSHVAMLTGTYPFHNGVQDFTGQPLAEKFRTLAESFRANGYRTGAVVSSFVLDRSWGLGRGFDFYYDQFAGLGAGEKDLGLVDRRAEESVGQALGWLGADPQQPFFFWLHLFDPHSPYDAPEPFRARYRERPYDGEVAYVDSQLARVFDWLRRQPKGAYENTVIVLVGDHGESLGEHGEQEHGFFIYDSTIRVPLLIKAPARAGLQAGRIGAAVETTALGPTILELAGIQDAIQKQFQAESLLARMRDTATEAARPAYSETFYPFSSFGWSPLRSLQTSRYQFIDAPQPELYDLRADPGQLNNLARTESKLVESFRAQLQSLVAQYRGEPVAPAAGQSADVAEKLRTLGYVAYRAPTTSLDLAKLRDPKERLATFNAILRATDAFSAGNYSAGQTALARVEREEPKLYLIPFLRGEAASRAGDWKTAAAEFQKTLKLNPHFDQAMLGLGRALNYQGKNIQATAWLEKALAQNSANYRAWFELSRVQVQRDPASARASLEKALAIQPAFGPAHRDLGLLAMREQRYSDGAVRFERAVQLGLTDAATHNYLGICYSRTDRLQSAVESYRRALAVDTNFAQAHLNLGFAYERMNQPAQAAEEYRAACRLDRKLCSLIEQRSRLR
jgi:arylsulfatase A-like enzyme/Tfp pilus assembly protein PilF